MREHYTIDVFGWGEYKDWSTHGTWYSLRHPRYIYYIPYIIGCVISIKAIQAPVTSSLYRSIGWSQRVEEKKYRPIVRKIRYLVIVGEFKKNVTRQTWRALFHFGEYLFQSTRHFGECLKKMVSHTVCMMIIMIGCQEGNTCSSV